MNAKELARMMKEEASEDGRMSADTANSFMPYLDDGISPGEVDAELEKLGVKVELPPDLTEEQLAAQRRVAGIVAKAMSGKDRETPQAADIDPIGRGLLG